MQNHKKLVKKELRLISGVLRVHNKNYSIVFGVDSLTYERYKTRQILGAAPKS